MFRRGKLVYVDPDLGLDFICEPACRFACQKFSVGEVFVVLGFCSCATRNACAHGAWFSSWESGDCILRNVMLLPYLQDARPAFRLSHTQEDADTNFIMMVDRGPSKF